MSLDFIYDTPSAILLIIFILVFLVFALVGLYIFTILTTDNFNTRFNDSNTSTYVSVVATAMAIIIAFIITDEYQTYNTTALNLGREANAIFILIEILAELEQRETILVTIKYLCSIINIEFPLMESAIVPPENTCLNVLQDLVLDYIPETNKQTVLYDKAIDQLNLAINLRNFRLEQTVAGIPPEFWWLLFIGITILIILTWFITGDPLYRIIMTSLVTIIYATLLFLVAVLDYPFRGYFSLGPENFQFVLDELGVTICPTEPCDNNRIKSLKKTVAVSCSLDGNNL